MYPEINLFALYNRFTGHKNNHPELYSIVEVAYHQTAIKKAHTAFKNAQNCKGQVEFMRFANSHVGGAAHAPKIKNSHSIKLIGFSPMISTTLECLDNPRSYEIVMESENKVVLWVICEREPKPCTGTKSKGIDIGVRKPFTVTTIDNDKITDGAWYDMTQKEMDLIREINQLKSRISKMHRRSMRWKKANGRLQKLYRRKQNLTKHSVRMRAKEFTNGTKQVTVENIRVRNLMRKGGSAKRTFNRRFNAANTYKTTQATERRCAKYSSEFSRISPQYTSQMCVSCRHVAKENRYNEDFKCVECGFSIDADHGASANITLATHPDPKKIRAAAVGEEFVGLFVRRELDPTGRYFMEAPVPLREYRTHGRAGFRLLSEKRHQTVFHSKSG